MSPYPYHSCSSYRDYQDDSIVYCIIRATSDSHSYTWGFSDSDRGRCGSTSYSDTSRVIGHASYWVDSDRFTFTSSYRGLDPSEFRVRGWCSSTLGLSPHLSARLDCSYPAIWPLGFGAWRQRGRGSEYVRFRRSMWDGLVLLCVILHAFTFTLMHYVICDICVRLMWHVFSLPWYICHVTWLCSFALLPCFTPIQMSFTL